MNISYGVFPENETFNPKQKGWHKLEEPDPIRAQMVSLPVGIVASLITMVLGIPFFQITISLWDIIIGVIGSIFVIIPFHQLIHAGAFPEDPRSKNVIFGYHKASLTFFAFFNGPIARSKFLTHLIAPFVVLSIIPTMVMYTFHAYLNIVMVMMIINALLCSTDFMTLYRVLRKVPKKATIRRKGYDLYWSTNEK